jgi:hypothetical protein
MSLAPPRARSALLAALLAASALLPAAGPAAAAPATAGPIPAARVATGPAPAGPVTTYRHARADGLSVTLSSQLIVSGDVVHATGANWPAGQLIQLVTCGELGVNGSGGCDMRAAVATTVRADGGFDIDVVIGDPPKPCPCVLHVAMVGAGGNGHVDAPLDIAGHARGEVPPTGVRVARLEVVGARLTGGNGFTAWLGGEQRRTLVYTVRNPGPEPVRDLPLTVLVGKGGGGDPAAVPDSGELVAGQTRTYEVEVTIPFAAFGRYAVRADLGGLAPASVPHDAYPWGLLLANVLGLLLIGWGVARRLRSRRRRAAPVLAGPGELLLPSVVRLPELRAYLVFEDAPGSRRLRRLAGDQLAGARLRALLDEPAAGPGSAVIDLEALDRLLAQRLADQSPPAGPAQPIPTRQEMS